MQAASHGTLENEGAPDDADVRDLLNLIAVAKITMKLTRHLENLMKVFISWSGPQSKAIAR